MTNNKDKPQDPEKKSGGSGLIVIGIVLVVLTLFGTFYTTKKTEIPEFENIGSADETSAKIQEDQEDNAVPGAKEPVDIDETAANNQKQSEQNLEAEETQEEEIDNSGEEPEEKPSQINQATTSPSETKENKTVSADAEQQVNQSNMNTASSLDIAKLAEPRILGDKTAPVKITEHASLNCSHCAHFHKEIFKRLKQDYIDTGKAYLVYSDMPLNIQAVQASMVARCIPEDRYFNFIQLLFETQEDWAFSKDFKTKLKQNAMLAGLNEKTFDACFDSKELQQAILQGAEKAHKENNISSTPTVVIDDTTIIEGARGYEMYEEVIKERLSLKKKQ